MKELFKTLFFNIIGFFILYKSSCYIHDHNDTSFLIVAALCILVGIGICFIRVDYLKPTDKKIAECSIILFLYALKRKWNEIEIDEKYERALNNSHLGEVVKEFIDMTDENI